MANMPLQGKLQISCDFLSLIANAEADTARTDLLAEVSQVLSTVWEVLDSLSMAKLHVRLAWIRLLIDDSLEQC